MQGRSATPECFNQLTCGFDSLMVCLPVVGLTTVSRCLVAARMASAVSPAVAISICRVEMIESAVTIGLVLGRGGRVGSLGKSGRLNVETLPVAPVHAAADVTGLPD